MNLFSKENVQIKTRQIITQAKNKDLIKFAGEAADIFFGWNLLVKVSFE